MEPIKFQDVNIFILIGIELFLFGLVYWKYKSEKRRREKLEYHYEDYGFGRMQSWRPFIIPIVAFIFISWELINRLYKYIYF
ncbi:MAG: hypothetical protein B7Y83_09945 [Flavobacteriales bacterium 32-34-25]|nr:MAG: hypothetical protein B7Y83_09945 [Flavobacteriales bacterium 32-34-25]